MQPRPLPPAASKRVLSGLPFVEALARRLAASMPHSIDIGDLVQDGVLGLIDAARRFDEGRGIKFETFAERRVRGAMIDALRRDAWPRGVRRVRRELEAAREALRRELGYEPSMTDLAARVGCDEKRLGRTIVRINTIESTSPLAAGDHLDETSLPAALVPSEPDAPDTAYEKTEVQERIRAAMASLPPRERRLIGLYYFGEITMKQIGAELGVNESRVSQLHARAIQRLRQAFSASGVPAALRPAMAVPAAVVQRAAARPVAANVRQFVPAPRPVQPAVRPLPDWFRTAILRFHQPKPKMLKAGLAPARGRGAAASAAVAHSSTSSATRNRSANRNGLASQRQPVSSRKRSASVPTTSPVTKTTRRVSSGLAAAMVR
jgi:RNA polymerase sigma factor for flagellar operon FliA